MAGGQPSQRKRLRTPVSISKLSKAVFFMLKISQAGTANHAVTLKLEGRVVGPWVSELRETCEKFLGEGRTVRLNLGEVSFVDQDGVKFLASLISKGVTLVDCSLFVEEQLRSASND